MLIVVHTLLTSFRRCLIFDLCASKMYAAFRVINARMHPKAMTISIPVQPTFYVPVAVFPDGDRVEMTSAANV